MKEGYAIGRGYYRSLATRGQVTFLWSEQLLAFEGGEAPRIFLNTAVHASDMDTFL